MLISESRALLVCKASCKSSREFGFVFNPFSLCQSSNNANIIAETKYCIDKNQMKKCIFPNQIDSIAFFITTYLVNVACVTAVETQPVSIRLRWKSALSIRS